MNTVNGGKEKRRKEKKKKKIGGQIELTQSTPKKKNLFFSFSFFLFEKRRNQEG